MVTTLKSIFKIFLKNANLTNQQYEKIKVSSGDASGNSRAIVTIGHRFYHVTLECHLLNFVIRCRDIPLRMSKNWPFIPRFGPDSVKGQSDLFRDELTLKS